LDWGGLCTQLLWSSSQEFVHWMKQWASTSYSSKWVTLEQLLMPCSSTSHSLEVQYTIAYCICLVPRLAYVLWDHMQDEICHRVWQGLWWPQEAMHYENIISETSVSCYALALFPKVLASFQYI
jgi:hypothetical protein